MSVSTQILWGFLVMAVVGLATAMMLAELIFPIAHPGGQCIWLSKLVSYTVTQPLTLYSVREGWFLGRGSVATQCQSAGTLIRCQVTVHGVAVSQVLLSPLGTLHHPNTVSSITNYGIIHACRSLYYGFDLIATS